VKWLPDKAIGRLLDLAQDSPSEASFVDALEDRSRLARGRGEIINNRFEVIAPIAIGGMSEVVRARDLSRGGEVAVKISTAGGPVDERFAREAAVLAALHHPHIVAYIDHGMTGDGAFYIAMELLQGEPVSVTARRGGLSVAEVVVLARGVASALGAAHDLGIVHRDVKPSNIFLQGYDVRAAKLLDFGLVRRAVEEVDLTRTGSFLGTPGYLAPEQARGERDIDARADVFSLACVVYECLTGTPAFQKSTVTDTITSILLEELADIRRWRPDVPPGLAELLARMLRKEPRARPPSAQAVVVALDAIAYAAGPGGLPVDPPTLVRERGLTSRLPHVAEMPSLSSNHSVIEPATLELQSTHLRRGEEFYVADSGEARPPVPTNVEYRAHERSRRTARAMSVIPWALTFVAAIVAAAAGLRATGGEPSARVAIGSARIAAHVPPRTRPTPPPPNPQTPVLDLDPPESLAQEPSTANGSLEEMPIARPRNGGGRPRAVRPAPSSRPAPAKGSVPLPKDPG
jgi:serine/threonine protein kinase